MNIKFYELLRKVFFRVDELLMIERKGTIIDENLSLLFGYSIRFNF